MSRARAPWSGRKALLALAAPMVAAAACRAIAPAMPIGTVGGQVALAALLTLPGWILALSPGWSLLVGLLSRRYLPALGMGLACALLGGIPMAGAAGGPTAAGWLRVVTANVNAFSDDPDRGALERALGELDADVVVVIEKRALAIAGMERVADNFGADLPRESHATAVWCRPQLGCRAEVTPEFGSPTSKMPLGIVALPGELCLLAVHAPPPVPKNASGNLPYARTVAAALRDGRLARAWGPCDAGAGVVVAGDLNAVPGSPALRALHEGGLSDALRWHGAWAASWPAGGGWPDLPLFHLDHVLAGAASVAGVRLARVPGSDHKALVFSVAARSPSDTRAAR